MRALHPHEKVPIVFSKTGVHSLPVPQRLGKQKMSTSQGRQSSVVYARGASLEIRRSVHRQFRSPNGTALNHQRILWSFMHALCAFYASLRLSSMQQKPYSYGVFHSTTQNSFPNLECLGQAVGFDYYWVETGVRKVLIRQPAHLGEIRLPAQADP